MTIHPEYDADTVDNDVAMLRLPVTLTASSSRGVACLPAPNQPLPANQLCTIIGWGKSRVTDDFGTDVLHEARVRSFVLPNLEKLVKFLPYLRENSRIFEKLCFSVVTFSTTVREKIIHE